SKFEAALRNNLDRAVDERKLSVISTAFIRKGVPARLTTFLAALLAAVLSTLLIVPKTPSRP
ncbi:MAG: hypothetical protein MUE74_14130, partial [Bacteroidales bacterium]|nr:hypothetical protein [Bacteroidales bacterium]